MISENVERNLIETGVYGTLAKVYEVVIKILVVNIIAQLVLFFFAPPTAVMSLLAGITVGMLIFMIVTAFTVRADKISRKEVRANG